MSRVSPVTLAGSHGVVPASIDRMSSAVLGFSDAHIRYLGIVDFAMNIQVASAARFIGSCCPCTQWADLLVSLFVTSPFKAPFRAARDASSELGLIVDGFKDDLVAIVCYLWENFCLLPRVGSGTGMGGVYPSQALLGVSRRRRLRAGALFSQTDARHVSHLSCTVYDNYPPQLWYLVSQALWSSRVRIGAVAGAERESSSERGSGGARLVLAMSVRSKRRANTPEGGT